MKLVVGLGNPGEKFKKNRHNVGQRFVREANFKFEIRNLKLLETDCFMNESGKRVAEVVKRYRGDWGNQGDWGQNLVIVHDDLDIPLGQFKVQFGVGPKVHNGVSSVEEALGTKDFWRVRIGVDNRSNSKEQKLGDTGREYVLEDFSDEEMAVLDGVFPKIWEELDQKIQEDQDSNSNIQKQDSKSKA